LACRTCSGRGKEKRGERKKPSSISDHRRRRTSFKKKRKKDEGGAESTARPAGVKKGKFVTFSTRSFDFEGRKKLVFFLQVPAVSDSEGKGDKPWVLVQGRPDRVACERSISLRNDIISVLLRAGRREERKEEKEKRIGQRRNLRTFLFFLMK